MYGFLTEVWISIDKKFKRHYNGDTKGTTGRRLALQSYQVTAGLQAGRLLLFIATLYKSNNFYNQNRKCDQIAKAHCHSIAPFLREIRGLQKLPSYACADRGPTAYRYW
jgi:hypothetical protein